MNPAIPIAREVNIIRAVDRRVASDGRAWNSLRGDCIVAKQSAYTLILSDPVDPIIRIRSRVDYLPTAF